MKTSYMDRDSTAAMKGIALILMFLYHFFMFPEWYLEGISYPALTSLIALCRTPLKICVSIFAFLTGYFYAFAKEKTFRYSIRKIADFLTSYWVVYLLFLVTALLLGCYEFRLSAFVYELFAFERPIMFFCWYVFFYCASMLVLPVVCRGNHQSLFEDTWMVMILPVAACFIAMRLTANGVLLEVLSAVYEWFPCTAAGYLIAKYSLFETVFDRYLDRLPFKIGKWLVLPVMLAVAFFGRSISSSASLSKLGIQWQMDIFYAPFFVYAAAKMLQPIKGSRLFKGLGKIGKQSSLMWFLHCAFFNVLNIYLQPVLYFPKNPVLVLLWGLLLCYLAAIAISCLVDRLLSLRKKLLILTSDSK